MIRKILLQTRISLEELGELDTSNLLCIAGHLGSVLIVVY